MCLPFMNEVCEIAPQTNINTYIRNSTLKSKQPFWRADIGQKVFSSYIGLSAWYDSFSVIFSIKGTSIKFLS